MSLPSLRVEKYHKVYRAVDEKGVDELYALLVVTKVDWLFPCRARVELPAVDPISSDHVVT